MGGRAGAILVVGLAAHPAVAVAEAAAWSSGTAFTLPEGQSEVGLFQPLRYGLSDSVEVVTHPLLNFLMPNVGLKAVWLTKDCWQVAGNHELTYPTGLFTALAKEGVGGLVTHETRVPHLVGLNNEILASWSPLAQLRVTPKLGAMLAARIGESTLHSIDLPVIYPRMAAYRRGWSINAGVDVDGRLYGPLWFSADIDVFVLSTKQGRVHFEQSGLVIWEVSEALRVMLGYKLVYGAYAFGYEWNLGNGWWPLPLADLQWSFD